MQVVKRDTELTVAPGPPPAKRLLSDEDSPPEKNAPPTLGTHIKISNRGNGNDCSNLTFFLPLSLSLFSRRNEILGYIFSR